MGQTLAVWGRPLVRFWDRWPAFAIRGLGYSKTLVDEGYACIISITFMVISGDGPVARTMRNLITEPSILRALVVCNHNRRRSRLSDDLYIMQYSFDFTTVKIGRSYDVETRRRGLEASQNFRVITIKVYPGLGCLETRMHAKLRKLRCAHGAGKEWFHLTAESAVTILSVYALRRRLWTGCKRARKDITTHCSIQMG
jgi:hypothetical protein